MKGFVCGDTGQSVAAKSLGSCHDRVLARVEHRRLKPVVGGGASVGQQHDAGQQPAPWAAGTTSPVGSAGRDSEFGEFGHPHHTAVARPVQLVSCGGPCSSNHDSMLNS